MRRPQQVDWLAGDMRFDNAAFFASLPPRTYGPVRDPRGPLLTSGAPFGLGLIACSATKAAHLSPASELYQGHTFKLALALATRLCQRVRILSGFHGVLALDTKVMPYERALTDMPREAKLAWASRVGRALEPWAQESVLCLAPRSYWQHVRGSASWIRPLAGLGIGQQKAALKRLLEDASSLVASSGRSS